jgi:hypothetical protein
MNMAVGGSRGNGRKIPPERMTCERNLGTNGSSSAGPRLNEGAQQGPAGFLVLTTAVEDMFSGRDKIVPRLVCRGTHTGPYGGMEAVGERVEVPDSAVWPSGRKVDESSTVPDQFAPLKQIGNLPGGACPAQPGRRPVPARRRHVARTCDGGAQAPVGLRPALSPADSAARCARPCPRPASMGTPSLFPGLGRIFPGQRGYRGFGSVKHVTLMHVHHG